MFRISGERSNITNCLWHGFFTSRGLHYNQDSSNNKLQTCIEKMHIAANPTTLFCWDSSPKVKFLGQSQTLGQRNLPSSELELDIFFLYHLPSCPPHQPLPQITRPWTKTLHRPVHLFTIVQSGAEGPCAWLCYDKDPKAVGSNGTAASMCP